MSGTIAYPTSGIGFEPMFKALRIQHHYSDMLIVDMSLLLFLLSCQLS
jgi:hypothetical protein